MKKQLLLLLFAVFLLTAVSVCAETIRVTAQTRLKNRVARFILPQFFYRFDMNIT